MTVLEQKVEKALDSVRDYLKADGGDVRVVRVRDDMVAEVELLGNCGSCSISHMTMKAGLEEAVRRALPEIVRLEAVESES